MDFCKLYLSQNHLHDRITYFPSETCST